MFFKVISSGDVSGGQVVQLIMEYLPLGSLREYLPKNRLGFTQNLLFAQQICQVDTDMPDIFTASLRN